MQINLHIGVHFTGAPRLHKAVLTNARVYKRNGTIASQVADFRAPIDETLKTLAGLPATREESRALIDQIVDGKQAERAILIDADRCAPPRRIFGQTGFYPDLGKQIRTLSELFCDADLRISLALLNPATFVGHALTKARTKRQAERFIETVDPSEISWLETISRVRETCPAIPLTLWADEDAPVIGGQILRHLGGLSEQTEIRAEIMMLQAALTEEGAARLRAYTAKFPAKNRAAFERIAMAFLDKYENVQTVGPEDGIGQWTDDALEEIAAGYEDDIAELSTRDGITFLQPTAIVEEMEEAL